MSELIVGFFLVTFWLLSRHPKRTYKRLHQGAIETCAGKGHIVNTLATTGQYDVSGRGICSFAMAARLGLEPRQTDPESVENADLLNVFNDFKIDVSFAAFKQVCSDNT